MDIILTCDNSYCQHAAVLISSICNHNHINTFYIVSDYISKENMLLIEKLCTKYNAKVKLLTVDKKLMSNFPIGRNTINPYLSLATYYRLFIPELLPKNMDRIIYIDCDIVVNGSLKELWEMQLEEETYIVALEEMDKIKSASIRRLNYNGKTYFNAGVLLLFINRLQKMKFTEKALDYINKNHGIIKYHDQDVLNALLYNHIQFIPLRYNVMDSFLRQNAILPERYKNQIDALYNPIVIHYTGVFKPWFIECNHPYKNLYFYYLSLTPWYNFTPTHKNKKLKEKLIYYLKSSCKVILSTLGIKKYSYLKDLPKAEILLKKTCPRIK